MNMFQFEKFNVNDLVSNLITYGIKIIIGILIIIVGFWVSSRFSRLIKNKLSLSSMSISLKSFVGDLLGVLVKILVILVAMNTVGIETTSFVALLGGIAVGVGMALQGSLANFAGGLLILIFKPFKVGDVVDVMGGNLGTVLEITILQTILETSDSKIIILPNGSVFGNPIVNYSKTESRRLEIVVGIGYDDDFDKAKKLVLEVLKKEPFVIHQKDYVVEIDNFGDSSVNLAIYVYVKLSDYNHAKWSLNREIKLVFDKNGINIPYPQRDIHIISK